MAELLEYVSIQSNEIEILIIGITAHIGQSLLSIIAHSLMSRVLLVQKLIPPPSLSSIFSNHFFLGLPLLLFPPIFHQCILFSEVPSYLHFACPNHVKLEILMFIIRGLLNKSYSTLFLYCFSMGWSLPPNALRPV